MLHILHTWFVHGEATMRSSRARTTPQKVDAWIEGIRERYQKRLDELLASRDPSGVKHQIHLPRGKADELIPQVAEDKKVDLIVMGTVSRTGISGFFIGNTAESVLNDVDCSVIALKPEGFVSPVTLED